MAEIVEIRTRDGEFSEEFDLSAVAQPIAGNPAGKNLLTMRQLNADDIHAYIEEAQAAEMALAANGGLNLLRFKVLKAVMRQPSTRTGGSCTTAMAKLGGFGELISGSEGSAEAKGEKLADSWVAYATQSDILGIRTYEDYGAAFAAHAIADAVKNGKLSKPVPVLNLGDGRNEHPTQALGDVFTIHKEFGKPENAIVTIVGDHERYRSHRSLMIAAARLGMDVVAVESSVAQVPPDLRMMLGDRLSRTDDLDAAMKDTDVLYLGRNPDEYTGKDLAEKDRQEQLARDYKAWTVDYERIQQMSPESIVLHPRPRTGELHPSVDADPRMRDVQQMENMIAMRMAIIARSLGISIVKRYPS